MNERETALYALGDILSSGGYGNIVLRRTFSADPSLTGTQKAFVTELVNGTIRNMIFTDYIINKFSKVQTNKMKPVILNILRLGVYQIMFMDRVPVSAACNEAVKLAKKRHFGTLSGFVNAVLRNIAENSQNIDLPKDKKEYLSVKYSVPMWITEYWLKNFPYERTEELCRASCERPEVSICVNTLKTTGAELEKRLEREGFETDFSDGFCFVKGGNSLKASNSFSEGLFHIMDKSSMTAVDVLDPREGQAIADICAAPGGKSFYAALKMKNRGRISSRDIHEHRLKLVDDGRKRLGLDIVYTEMKDAVICFEEDKNAFDGIIFDMPCSGLGIMRKKPDIKYTKKYSDIKSLADLQLKIFSACREYVKIGGTAVYCTCTVSPEENEENVKKICREFGYEPCGFSVPENMSRTDTGYGIQIFTGKSDGFFISKLIRRK